MLNFMGEDWLQREVELIVADYFNMLTLELSKKTYNKTAFRKALVPLLNYRSEGSIEFKHQNISAILANMGLPFIKGYKPRFNFQQLLEDEVASFLQKNHSLIEPMFEMFADKVELTSKTPIDFSTLLSQEPEMLEFKEREPTYQPIKINYLEREQNNRKLGEEGERLVIAYERFRLINVGKESLADKIEWISREKGDGAGFDILSKHENGADRFIEVKTTKLSKETPIYVTRTEVSFAQLKAKDFYLYRVYNIDLCPKMFIQNGQYDRYCQLVAQTFRGFF
jgi:hypothetical protein